MPINLFSKKEKTPSNIFYINEIVDKIIPDTNKNNNKSTIFFAKNIDGNYLLPEKKPITYKKPSLQIVEKSEILSKKDYEYAKQIFNNISQKKWSTVFPLTRKVKDKDFKNLVYWIYYKRTNKASFDDYIKFIDKNSNYPRINRLKYLAEHRINLNTTSPNTVIGWFVSNPPLSGYGKIKLGEFYLIKGEKTEGSRLIKEGCGFLKSKDLRYLNKKYKNILKTSDHINRAEYWEYKY